MLRSGLITPYRGVRYYLKEYLECSPENVKKIFSHQHSSLRNVIEMTFDVLKKQFSNISGVTELFFQLIWLLRLSWFVVYCTTIL